MTFHLRLSQRYAANRIGEPRLIPRRPPATTAAFRRRRMLAAAGRAAIGLAHVVAIAVGTAGIVAGLVALVYLAR